MPETDRGELVSIKFLLILLAIYTYLTGWAYEDTYLRSFGIPMNTVPIPLQYIYVYSYRVFSSRWGIGLLVACLASGYIIALYRKAQWGVFPLLLIAIPLCYTVAVRQGEHDAVLVRQGAVSTSISFILKRDALVGFTDTGFLKANNNGELRLIVQTEDRYFVLLQPYGEASELPFGRIYQVHKEDVIAVKVELPPVALDGRK